MPKIGLIFNGVWSHYTFATAPKYKDLFRLIYVHDLDADATEELDAICIPFQSNHHVITEKRQILADFLKSGKKIFVEGDSSPEWLDAKWEDRPVNNYWWVDNPDQPPVSNTDFTHPVYQGLLPRHACWHTHGAYTRIPSGAKVIQTNASGEVITWETTQYGGHLMATTLDPIVEHGIQQITHLDNYVDKLVEYLCGVKPSGRFSITDSLAGHER